MKTPNYTAAEMNAEGARILGYREESYRHLLKGEVQYYVDKEGCVVENFSPSARIDQALEVLDAWNKLDESDWGANYISIKYEGDVQVWYIQYKPDEDGDYAESKRCLREDLANQIMLTIMEMRNG